VCLVVKGLREGLRHLYGWIGLKLWVNNVIVGVESACRIGDKTQGSAPTTRQWCEEVVVSSTIGEIVIMVDAREK
jgi:hypothetical protein